MTQYLISCRSLTKAQKSVQLLERNGISAVLVKIPQGLSSSGCGYAVSIYRNVNQALAILKSSNLLNGKLFERQSGGGYREVAF